MLGLTETLFHDLAAAGAGDRIGVTAVCPGYVPTRIGYDDRRAAVPEPPPGAVSADDVAARVIEAIAERRVFVFTHEGTAEQVSARAAAIVDGRAHVRSRCRRPSALLSTASAASACLFMLTSLLITDSTVRSVSITNVLRLTGVIEIPPRFTPKVSATVRSTSDSSG